MDAREFGRQRNKSIKMDFLSNYKYTANWSLEFPLVHVTKDFKSLKSIIAEGLRYSYSTEWLHSKGKSIKIHHPIISFSDLNWSQAKIIMRSYGQYMIILKSDWARKKEFSPVLYIEEYSPVLNGIREILEEIGHNRSLIEHDLLSNPVAINGLVRKHTLNLLSYSKNYYGELIRKDEIVNSRYCFGAEREWRKVLRKTGFKPFLLDVDLPSIELNNVKKEKELFDLNDIEGVVVENEHQKKAIRILLAEKYQVTEDSINKIVKFYINHTNYIPDEG